MCCIWRLTFWSNQTLAGQSNQCFADPGSLGNPTVRSEKLLMRTEDESFSQDWFGPQELSTLLNWSILRNKPWRMQTAPLSLPQHGLPFYPKKEKISSTTFRGILHKSFLQSRIFVGWESCMCIVYSKLFTYIVFHIFPRISLAFKVLKHFEVLGLFYFCPAPSTKPPIAVIPHRWGIWKKKRKKDDVGTFSSSLKGHWVLLPLVFEFNRVQKDGVSFGY